MRAPSGISSPREAVRDSRGRRSARAAARTSRATGRMLSAAAEDPLPGDRVLAHDRPLGVVERARLVEDAVRHGDHADVAQLGGADRARRAPRRRGRAGGRRRPRASATPLLCVEAGSRSASTCTSRSRACPRLAAAAAALARVHALVGDAQRLGRVVERPRAARRARSEAPIVKPSPCSLSASTARCDRADVRRSTAPSSSRQNSSPPSR